MKAFIILTFLFFITKISFANEVFRKPSSEVNFVIEESSCLNTEKSDRNPIEMLELAKKAGFELISVTKISGNSKSTSTCAYYLSR